MDTSTLRSARYITTGYTNAFHRTFLYGVGLDEEDLAQPFAGLGVAWNEGGLEAAGVRQLADLAKAALWRQGITPREFLVPVSSVCHKPVAERELAADAVELAIRGHWYDAFVGIGAAAPAVIGMAMAVLRLRIPALILVPSSGEWPVQTARAVRLLEELTLGAPVTVMELDHVLSLTENLLTDLSVGSSAATHASDSLHRWTGRSSLPSNGTALRDLAALLHEIGHQSLLDILPEKMRILHLRADTVSYGLAAIVGDESDVEQNSCATVVDGDTLTLQNATASRIIAMPRYLSEDDWAVGTIVMLEGDRFSALTRAARAGEQIQVTSHASPADGEQLEDLLSCSRLSSSTHPGLVDSYLNYDRL